MVSLRSVGATTFLCLVAFFAQLGSGAGAEPSPREESFRYPLRAGESLTDVSRIFRVPLQQLMELNQITDPNRLSVGQTLTVPNSFAREAATLSSERDRLLKEKQLAERESAERQGAVANLEAQVRELQDERTALNREVAATGHWKKGAKVLSLLLLGAVAWALMARAQRAVLAWRLRALVAENAALETAKEKYRRACSQLELRYQRLYRGRGEAPAEVISEGASRLNRTFDEGSAQIERLVAGLREEREKEGRLLGAERRGLAQLFHFLRGLLTRNRLKYHTP